MEFVDSKIVFFIFLYILLPRNLYCQEAVVSSGGDISTTSGKLSFSVGQVIYTANTASSGSVQQGVQQVYLISVIGETQSSISIYPNPITDYLNLKIENYDLSEFSYQLFDLKGKLLMENKVEDEVTLIPMNKFPKSSYSIRVLKGGELTQSFKLTKY